MKTDCEITTVIENAFMFIYRSSVSEGKLQVRKDCGTQSPDRLTHYQLSRLGLTFMCHKFFPRPRGLETDLETVNISVGVSFQLLPSS